MGDRRTLINVAIAVCLVGPASRTSSRAASQPDAKQLSGWKALPGATSVLGPGKSISSLVLSGTATSGFTDGRPSTTPYSVAIKILLPDNYLRVEDDTQLLRRSGFAGPLVLNHWQALKPGVRFFMTPGPNELSAQRSIFRRMMLGVLAFVDLGERVAEVVEGAKTRGRSLRIIGSDGFAAWVDLALTTGMPAQVRYDDVRTVPAPITADQARAGIVPGPKPERVEMTEKFEYRKVIDGLSLPTRIIEETQGVVFQDLRLSTLTVNGPLTHRDFLLNGGS